MPPRRVLLWITAAAVALRLYILLLSPVIPADSALYLTCAREIGSSGLSAALRLTHLHPLFPLLTSVAAALLGDFAGAAALLSLAASAAAVPAVYALARLWWDERVSLGAALLFALHPILAHETAGALPTALLLFCFMAALACGLRALRGGSFGLFPLAGILAGLAYLTRTEGLLAAAFLGVAGLVVFFRGPDRRRLALGGAAAVLCAAAVAAPYVAWVSREAGHFTITLKGGGNVLLRAVQGRSTEIKDADLSFPYVPTVQRKLTYAFFAPLLPFLAAGLFLDRRELRRRLPPLLMGAAALAPPLLLFALNSHFRPSARYFLVSAALFLPWTAFAALSGFDFLRRRFAPRAWVATAAAALFFALLLGKNATPHRPRDRGLKIAGEWLAANPPRVPPYELLSTSDKLSWYARARHVSFLGTDAEAVLASAGAQGIRVLAIDSHSARELPAEFFEILERGGAALLKDFPETPEAVGARVYRLPGP